MNMNLHRWFNTSVSVLVLAGLIALSYFGYGKYVELNTLQLHKSEMNQITADEGFSKCAYTDSLGFSTIGFGHLVKRGEDYKSCITIATAFSLLHKDYLIALGSVERNYPWAEGEVKLVLANMSYQLGTTRLALFERTLRHLESKRYSKAAVEMIDSKWAEQTPRRSLRLAVRVLSLDR